MGMDMAKDACRSGSACAVFTASDLSEKSLKEMRFVCSRYQVGLYALEMSMDQIQKSMGRRTGIIAVTDKGFAKACAEGLRQIAPDADSDN